MRRVQIGAFRHNPLRGPRANEDVKKLLDETLSRTKRIVILGKTIVALPGRKASNERTVGAEGIARKPNRQKTCILRKIESSLRKGPAKFLLRGLRPFHVRL